MLTIVISNIYDYFTKYDKYWYTDINVIIIQYRPIVVTYDDNSLHQYHPLQLHDGVGR